MITNEALVMQSGEVPELADNFETELHDNCGIFAAYLESDFAKVTDIRSVVKNSLQALQHRGEEAAGIAVSDGANLHAIKGRGVVEKAFKGGKKLAKLPLGCQFAMGHVLYGTSGNTDESFDKRRIQPVVRDTEHGSFSLAHNGQVNFTQELREKYGLNPNEEISDTNTVADIVQLEYSRSGDFEEAVEIVCKQLVGAFAFTFMTENKIIGVCDRNGIRPMELGFVSGDNGYILSSETCAFNMADAHLIRSIQAGEMITIDQNGIRSKDIFPPEEIVPRRCLLEALYFSRPDSTTDYYPEGEDTSRVRLSFQTIRHKLGVLSAKNSPVEADAVTCVPESGRPGAEGYSKESGIPLITGIIKNSFVGRTFTAPSQLMRVSKVNLKLNPIKDLLYNKRLVVSDDTVVRSTTLKRLTKQLRKAAVRQVHYRIPSPQIKHPCVYGIDLSNYRELIAANNDVEQIRQHVGADSLSFLDVETTQATVAGSLAVKMYCDACMTGDYPTAVPIEIRKKTS